MSKRKKQKREGCPVCGCALCRCTPKPRPKPGGGYLRAAIEATVQAMAAKNVRGSGPPGPNATHYSTLGIALSAAVPLRVWELEQKGGPSDEDLKRAGEFSQVLGERGDVLLFGGKKGEAGNLFNRLAESIAVLAFCPGGIRTFGMEFAAGPNNPERKGVLT
jgi:hypothetical protein